MLTVKKLSLYDEFENINESLTNNIVFHPNELYSDFSIQNFISILNKYKLTNESKYILNSLFYLLTIEPIPLKQQISIFNSEIKTYTEVENRYNVKTVNKERPSFKEVSDDWLVFQINSNFKLVPETFYLPIPKNLQEYADNIKLLGSMFCFTAEWRTLQDDLNKTNPYDRVIFDNTDTLKNIQKNANPIIPKVDIDKSMKMNGKF